MSDRIIALFAFIALCAFVGILVFELQRLDITAVAVVTLALAGWDMLRSRDS
jgi:hypothetical protein